MSDLLQPVIDSPAFKSASLGLGLLMFLLSIALVFWLFRDARRRGSSGIIWALVAGFALLVGIIIGFSKLDFGFVTVGLGSLGMVLLALLIYTFVRPADFVADAQERELSQRLLEAELEKNACPSCGAGIETDFLICPSCNITLRRPCEYCSRPIKTAWATCPYCRAGKGKQAVAKKPVPKKRTSTGTAKKPANKPKPNSSATFKD